MNSNDSLSATVRIEIGKHARDYVKVMDKGIDYKRSKISVSADKNAILITVKAHDHVAMFATLNGALKQLRIISSVNKKLDELD